MARCMSGLGDQRLYQSQAPIEYTVGIVPGQRVQRALRASLWDVAGTRVDRRKNRNYTFFSVRHYRCIVQLRLGDRKPVEESLLRPGEAFE